MELTYKKLLLVIIVITLSCNQTEKKIQINTDQLFNQSVTVEEIDLLKFELDSVTSPIILTMQEYSDDENNFLIFLNEETKTLYVNDIDTRKIVKSINLKDEVDGNTRRYQGFHYHNKDSIFIFSISPNVTLINDFGEIEREFNLTQGIEENDRLFYQGLWSSTANHSHVYDNKLYISSVITGGNDLVRKKIQIILDLNSGRASGGEVLFPESYGQYEFGGNNFDIYSVTANRKDHLMVYSFPGYEKVIISNLVNNGIREISAQSRSITHFTEYNERNYKGIAKPKLEYFMTAPSYGGIYYDKYRDLYYRLALLPVMERGVNYDEKNPPYKQLVIVVFDADFNYLGEQELERDKYSMFNAFVSKDGFNIQNRMDTDETLDFTTFLVSSN